MMEDKHNSQCRMCRTPLNAKNVALDIGPTLRLDSTGHRWCIACTEEFDAIDWDKITDDRLAGVL